MESQSKSPHLAALERDGFVVIRSILSAGKLASLRAAALQIESLARSGNWPHVRTVGKQFPPWEFAPEKGIWGVQHLMHPGLAGHEVFTELYFSEEVLGVVRGLLGCEDDEELVMELLNMLVRPERDFELRWHRDDIPAEADAREEMERLARPAYHAQYNLALLDGDESLIVVPGSHRRARTATERSAGPFEARLPGQIVVKLQAGDIAFYNNNILHRGVYGSKRERLTVHGSVGHARGSCERARNVLQHGVGSWVDGLDLGRLRGREKERAEGMRERLVRMGRESRDVGYSLRG